MTTLSAAYAEGFAARRAGKGLDANPYPKPVKPNPYTVWRNGWKAAGIQVIKP